MTDNPETDKVARLTAENQRLRAKLDGYRCMDCGGEGGGGTMDPDVWIECRTCHGTGRHTDRAAVLREAADRFAAKAEAEPLRGYRYEAIKSVASELRRMADETQNEAAS